MLIPVYANNQYYYLLFLFISGKLPEPLLKITAKCVATGSNLFLSKAEAHNGPLDPVVGTWWKGREETPTYHVKRKSKKTVMISSFDRY